MNRYATAIALCELLPIPLVDTALQNRLRRRLIRRLAHEHGLDLDEATIGQLADEPIADPNRLLTWPARKLLAKAIPMWTAVQIGRSYAATMALSRSLSPAP